VSYDDLKARIQQVITVTAVIDGAGPVRVGEAYTLTGASSTGEINRYVWEADDGTRTEGVNFAHAWQTEGVHTVKLRTDNAAGGSSYDEVQMQVDAALQPPLANAGPDITATQGVAVTLDGSGSTGDNITTISWDPGDGSDPITGSLVATHTYAASGLYTATLTVSDGVSPSQDSAQVDVAATGTIPLPVVVINGPYTGEVGVPVQFSLEGSYVPRPENPIASVLWEFGDGGTSTERNPVHTYQSSAGSPYSVTLTIWNSEGGNASDTTTATISDPVGDVLPDWIDDGVALGPWQDVLPVPTVTGYPQISFGSLKTINFGASGDLALQRRACFDGGSQKPFGTSSWTDAQAIAAATTDANGEANFLRYGRRVCKAEYQGPGNAGIGDGPQFFQSAASTFVGTESGTPNGDVFPGHWLTMPYHTLTQTLTTGGTSMSVNSRTYLPSSCWAIIWSAADYSDAEFVKMGTVSSNTIALTSRGHKSVQTAHAAGSKVAAICLSQSQQAGSELWLRNMSDDCPVDGSGRKLWEAMALWCSNNFDRQGSTISVIPCEIHEVTDDSDWYVFSDRGSLIPLRQASCAVRPASEGPDYGFYNGRNTWAEGVKACWELLDSTIVSTRGIASRKNMCGGDYKVPAISAGNELEGLPDGAYTNTSAQHWDRTQYGYIQARLTTETGVGPNMTFPFCKSSLDRTDNLGHLATAMGCVLGGMVGAVNADLPWPWRDYWAVYLDVANHGDCVPINNYADIMANKHWMGAPLDRAFRKVNPADFQLTQALNNNHDATTDDSTSWATSGATVVLDPTTGYTANGRSWKITPNSIDPTNVTTRNASAPAIALQAGQDYTICVMVRAEDIRRMGLQMGSLVNQSILINPGWNKLVFSWRQGTTGNFRPRFNVGQSYDAIWVDQMLVFNAYAGTITREFERGLAVLKLDHDAARTIDLGGTWQRPNGVNVDDDGQQYTSVSFGSLPDGAIFVRPL
jgi:PKD repeat protein